MKMQDILARLSQMPPPDPEQIGKPPIELLAVLVRWGRSMRQWKISTLADFAAVSVSTIERVERAEAVSDEALDRIAQALGYAAGAFTAPRKPVPREDASQEIMDRLAHMEAVKVAPFRHHRQIREASRCVAHLIHRPEVPEIYEGEIDSLREWIDLASFVLADDVEEPFEPKHGRRRFYNDILSCIQELERRGVNVLFGTMDAPWAQFPGCKVAIVSLTPKLTDPGAPKRPYVYVDLKTLSFPTL